MNSYFWKFKKWFIGYCQNGGICKPMDARQGLQIIRCACSSGFSGERCEDDWCHQNGDYCLNRGIPVNSSVSWVNGIDRQGCAAEVAQNIPSILDIFMGAILIFRFSLLKHDGLVHFAY